MGIYSDEDIRRRLQAQRENLKKWFEAAAEVARQYQELTGGEKTAQILDRLAATVDQVDDVTIDYLDTIGDDLDEDYLKVPLHTALTQVGPDWRPKDARAFFARFIAQNS